MPMNTRATSRHVEGDEQEILETIPSNPTTRTTTAHEQASPQPTLAERVANAERIRDELLLQIQANSLEEEIKTLREKAINPTPSIELRERTSSYNSITSSHSGENIGEDIPRGEKRRREDSISLTRRNIQPERLKPYYGKTTRELKRFREDAETVFQLRSDTFEDDKTRILYAMQYLEGEPRDAWFAKLKSQDLDTYTWDQFMEELLNLIDDPMNRQLQLRVEYETARQRENQSAHAFHAYLSALEDQLGIPSSIDTTMTYYAKLRPELRAQMTNYQDLPKTRDGVVALAARLESNMNNIQRARPKAPSQSQAPKTPTARTLPYQSTKGERHSNTKWQKPTRYEKGKGKEVTCYKCKGVGHFANSTTYPLFRSLATSTQEKMVVNAAA
jgi:hypothetical protein